MQLKKTNTADIAKNAIIVATGEKVATTAIKAAGSIAGYGFKNITQLQRYRQLAKYGTKADEAAKLAKEIQWSKVARPKIGDVKLSKFMDELYRAESNIGNKSTADAIRLELKTGQPIKGKMHIQKGEDSIKFLEKWIKDNPKSSDVSKTKNVIEDLTNALSGN